jgi:hypothetical protein
MTEEQLIVGALAVFCLGMCAGYGLCLFVWRRTLTELRRSRI